MKTLKITLITLAYLSLTTACHDEPPKPDLHIYITGKVIDEKTGLPITYAICYLYEESTLIYTAYADLNGQYNLKFLPKADSPGGTNLYNYLIKYDALGYNLKSEYIVTTKCIKKRRGIFSLVLFLVRSMV